MFEDNFEFQLSKKCTRPGGARYLSRKEKGVCGQEKEKIPIQYSIFPISDPSLPILNEQDFSHL